MLANLLYLIWPYQIFKSVFFRGGMAFLTTYFIIVVGMPPLIRYLRQKGFSGDFGQNGQANRPYSGGKPIMGGGLLIAGIVAAAVLWMEWNQFLVALVMILLSFAAIGAWDDIAKIRHRRKVELGSAQKATYTDKADGASGWVRLSMEIGVALIVVVVLYRFITIDGHLVVPFIPLKWWYPYLPRYLFIPFMVFIIVAGANAVNLTDGMDSLATVPILTCAAFVAAAAYVGSDPEWAARLKLPLLPPQLKEMVVMSAAMVAAGLAFLRFNAPPAMITLGDTGALALGSTFSAMFIFTKVELFLPIVGGVFVLTTISTIIQRLYFKWVVFRRGREEAKKHRFFYRAPYHHHLQAVWQFSEEKREITSVWEGWLKRLGVQRPPPEDQLTRAEDVNNRVIWRIHMLSIWLAVAGLVIYFKVR